MQSLMVTTIKILFEGKNALTGSVSARTWGQRFQGSALNLPLSYSASRMNPEASLQKSS